MAKKVKRGPFVAFCAEVFGLSLTVPWRVLLAVAVDGVQPKDLVGDEREVARVLFADVEEIDPRLRRVLIWRLGRASGKSTIAAALAAWAAWTADLSRVGKGHVACSFIVSPTKPIAKIALNVARELVRESSLEKYVVDDTADGFALKRPDGRVVEIRCVAASRGGANLRGRDVIVLVLDESEFFQSAEDGAVEGYSVTDRDQIAAAMPRLLEHAVCISTPWPSDNVTAEYFDRNHGHPIDALAALGTSTFMRPGEQLARDREREMIRDEDTALREFDCAPGARGGSKFSTRSRSPRASSRGERSPSAPHAAPSSGAAATWRSSATPPRSRSSPPLVRCSSFWSSTRCGPREGHRSRRATSFAIVSRR